MKILDRELSTHLQDLYLTRINRYRNWEPYWLTNTITQETWTVKQRDPNRRKYKDLQPYKTTTNDILYRCADTDTTRDRVWYITHHVYPVGIRAYVMDLGGIDNVRDGHRLARTFYSYHNVSVGVEHNCVDGLLELKLDLNMFFDSDFNTRSLTILEIFTGPLR